MRESSLLARYCFRLMIRICAVTTYAKEKERIPNVNILKSLTAATGVSEDGGNPLLIVRNYYMFLAQFHSEIAISQS